jgi:hypothetical protein
MLFIYNGLSSLFPEVEGYFQSMQHFRQKDLFKNQLKQLI